MESFKLRSVIKHKRGGLELSVNSIVILIFAITILSLGLVFIKKMFGGTTEAFSNVTGQVQSSLKSDLENSHGRLAFYNYKITVAPGASGTLDFAIRNELADGAVFNITGGKVEATGQWDKDGSVVACYSSTGTSDGKVPSTYFTFDSLINKNGVYLNPGEIRVWSLTVNVNSSADEGLYQCVMLIANPSDSSKEYARKDFQINVQR